MTRSRVHNVHELMRCTQLLSYVMCASSNVQIESWGIFHQMLIGDVIDQAVGGRVHGWIYI